MHKPFAQLCLRSFVSVPVRQLESGLLFVAPLTQHNGQPMNDKSNTLSARLLTVREIAAYCQVNDKTVRRWIEAKELAAFKLGRQWRIEEKDLRRFLNDRWTG